MGLAILALFAAVIVGDAAGPAALAQKSLHGRAFLETLSAAHLGKPIGEGAYQSHEAVKERTTDKNLHCEEQKWGPCYRHDYIDKRGSPPTPAPPPAPKKS